MKLDNVDQILIASALRQKATALAELACQPGGKAYRDHQRKLALQYERLADAFNNHTNIELTK